jgi:hypothetical protein
MVEQMVCYRRVVACSAEQRGAGECVGGIEAGVVAHDIDETADEQAGGGKEHDGKRDFDDEQSVAQEALLARLGEPHSGGLEGGAEIETRAADGGREAEEQRGDEGEADSEGKHPSVDLNYGA